MSRRYLAALALAGPGLAGTVLALSVLSPPDDLRLVSLRVAIGLVWIAAGLVAWWRRPENRTGPLMTAVGFLHLLVTLHWNGSDALDPISFTATGLILNLYVAVAAHLFVAFPRGRLETRPERLIVASAYAVALAFTVADRVFVEPAQFGCDKCPQNLVLIRADRELAETIENAGDLVGAVLACAIIWLLLRRWRSSSVAARRAIAPVLATGAVALLLLGLTSRTDFPGLWVAAVAALGAPPLAFLAGLLRTRLHRSALTQLVVELGTMPPPARVREALARTLGDPSLELAFWLAESDRYVDSEGRPADLAVESGGRAVTVLEHDGRRVAALICDPSLLEDRELVEAVGAAARLALENSRLQAELRARLREVRASRARIVEASDAERRRIERDLHDGAQQRLLGIRLALRLVRSRLGEAGDAAEELLAEAEGELEGTLEELRALARGIHPAVLSDEGLAPALEALARRAPVPVEIAAVPLERLPEPVEAAAYFLASEALANVAKHARASRVTIEIVRANGQAVIDIADDGVGGADAVRGTGLLGLRDRVEALDGSFRVESPPGRGTRLHAEIPCAESSETG